MIQLKKWLSEYDDTALENLSTDERVELFGLVRLNPDEDHSDFFNFLSIETVGDLVREYLSDLYELDDLGW